MSRIVGMVAAAVGAALCAVAAELAARSVIRRQRVYYRYLPEMRVRFVVDRAALPALGPVARVHINRDGERGGPPPRAGEGAFRALVVGGSAAECAYLDQDETWSAVVERILGQAENLRALGASRAHVGAVARAIAPCAEIDWMLRKMLPRYPKLDLVLVMVGAADLVRWMERGLPRSIPEAQPDPSRLFEEHPEVAFGWTPRRSALWRVARRLDRRVRRRVETIPDAGAWLHRVRRMRAEAPHLIDEPPDATPLLDRFGRDLAALLRTATAGASRVILVRQPWLGGQLPPEQEQMMWNFGLGRPYREEVTTYFTPRAVDALMRLVDARAAAVAVELGVEQIDISPHIEHSPRMFYDYLHFTPEGAEVVGRVVANAIVTGRPAA